MGVKLLSRLLKSECYDQTKQVLLGENSGLLFKSGMEVSVKITEVVPLTGSITVKFVSGGTKRKEKRFKKRRRK